MATAGLKCWDAQGNLVVDLTELQLRFVQSGQITIPSLATSYDLSVPGINSDTHTVFITGGPNYGVPLHLVVVPGAIRIYTWLQYGIFGGITLSYDLYRYK